ncbi:hypothetical protein SDC9_69765 [bioreactor metagenome]|uniref:Uncharacterized protein n=1 Tax=bioreactor metagenome TaxID=1076179 RepID=A0A644YAY3_9ZZZZ
MRAGNHRRAVVQQILNGRQRRNNALVAGNGSGGLVQRHIEVAPEQDLPAADVHVLDCLLIVVHMHPP